MDEAHTKTELAFMNFSFSDKPILRTNEMEITQNTKNKWSFLSGEKKKNTTVPGKKWVRRWRRKNNPSGSL